MAVASCKIKQLEKAEKPKFTFFELAYSNGWTNGPVFRVDSTGIFFFPLTTEMLQYGLLPDSIVKQIDKTLTKAAQDSSIKSSDKKCEDCASIAVIARVGDRDIRIIQSDKIDTGLLLIVSAFNKFLQTEKQKTIDATFIPETQRIVWPAPSPPRPLRKDLNFVIPKQESEGSR